MLALAPKRPSSGGRGTGIPTPSLSGPSGVPVNCVLWWRLCLVLWWSPPLVAARVTRPLAIAGGRLPDARRCGYGEGGEGSAAAATAAAEAAAAGGGGANGANGAGADPPPPPSPSGLPPGGGGGGQPPRRNQPRDARRAVFSVDDEDENDADNDDDEWQPDAEYGSGNISTCGYDASAGRSHLQGGHPPSHFNRTGERHPLHRLVPIWGFSLPSSRPDEFGHRFPRPFRVHNDSRWSDAFASSPAPVVEDARTIYNACAWTQALHNRLLAAKTDRLDGQLLARQLLNEVIYARTALHQLFLILVT